MPGYNTRITELRTTLGRAGIHLEVRGATESIRTSACTEDARTREQAGCALIDAEAEITALGIQISPLRRSLDRVVPGAFGVDGAGGDEPQTVVVDSQLWAVLQGDVARGAFARGHPARLPPAHVRRVDGGVAGRHAILAIEAHQAPGGAHRGR